MVLIHSANLKPLSHLQQPLFKGWQYPSISSGTNVEQKVPITTDSGDQLIEKLSGIVKHISLLCAIVAPRALLYRVAALPLVRNQIAWTESVE